MNRIIASPSGKRHSGARDYINNLPDGVLSRILSRLSLKDAVRTCVLSKDWEFKWTSIYNVNFDISFFSRKWRNELSFVYIINKVLHHLQNVRNFSLSYTFPIDQESSRITMLVSVILRRNVKRLELDIYNPQNFFLPRSLFNSASLKKLALIFENHCSLRVPAKNCLPKLKYLTLEGVKILNDNSNNNTLIFTFPVLKVLELVNCKWIKVKFVELYAPSLRRFTSLPPLKNNDKKDSAYSIKILGSMIDALNIGHQEDIIMNGSNVNHLNLDCYCTATHPLPSLDECGLQVRKLLRGLRNLEYLSMGDLQAVRQTKLGLPFPRFHQLKHLHLTLTKPFDAVGLLELLHATPFLNSLVICLDNSQDYVYYSVKNIPSCVVHHLEKVTLNYCCCPKPNFFSGEVLVEEWSTPKDGSCLESFRFKEFNRK